MVPRWAVSLADDAGQVRLMSHVVVVENCWEWIGAMSVDGYGVCRRLRRNLYAHRVVYESFVGQIPSGLVLDHLCNNKRCVNPHHLKPVTQRENILRGAGTSAAHAAKTECLKGHPLSGENMKIGKRGSRVCITCERTRSLASYYRNRPQSRRSGATA